MKKLFLFLAATTLALTSCSSDDDGGSAAQSFKFTINGTEKTFSSIVVNEDVEGDYTLLTITALNTNNPSENISFYVEKGDVGADVAWNFDYTAGGVSYDNYNEGSNFNIVITQNSNNRLKGTFSGILSGYDSNAEEMVTTQLTGGSFDFGY